MPPFKLDALLRLGPLTAHVRLQGADGEILTHEHVQRRWGPFLLDPATDPEPDISLDLNVEEGPWPRPGRRQLNNLVPRLDAGVWSVRRDDIDASLDLGTLHLQGHIAPRLPAIEECLRFLMWLALTREPFEGLLIHASSTTSRDRAFCFPANSGTGKSTLAELTPGTLPLSDEISLLTRQDGAWVAWPCPFWNWPRQSRPDTDASRPFPLAAVGFLAQAPTTRFVPMRSDDALTALMAQTVAFDAFPAASGRTFMLAADLIQALRTRGALGTLHLRRGEDPYGPILER